MKFILYKKQTKKKKKDVVCWRYFQLMCLDMYMTVVVLAH